MLKCSYTRITCVHFIRQSNEVGKGMYVHVYARTYIPICVHMYKDHCACLTCVQGKPCTLMKKIKILKIKLLCIFLVNINFWEAPNPVFHAYTWKRLLIMCDIFMHSKNTWVVSANVILCIKSNFYNVFCCNNGLFWHMVLLLISI